MSSSTPNKQSFWTTLPGILTGIAGVVTASAALVGALATAGFFDDDEPPPTVTSTAEPTATERPDEQTGSPDWVFTDFPDWVEVDPDPAIAEDGFAILTAGSGYSFVFNVANEGDGASTAIAIEARLQCGGVSETLGFASVGSLEAGGRTQGSVEATIPRGFAGSEDCVLIATLDPENDAAETNEGNNEVRSASLYVQ